MFSAIEQSNIMFTLQCFSYKVLAKKDSTAKYENVHIDLNFVEIYGMECNLLRLIEFLVSFYN